eukprot:scaffold616_cov257-Pinguiococcus_pyrenoidosus.AAC.3
MDSAPFAQPKPLVFPGGRVVLEVERAICGDDAAWRRPREWRTTMEALRRKPTILGRKYGLFLRKCRAFAITHPSIRLRGQRDGGPEGVAHQPTHAQVERHEEQRGEAPAQAGGPRGVGLRGHTTLGFGGNKGFVFGLSGEILPVLNMCFNIGFCMGIRLDVRTGDRHSR